MKILKDEDYFGYDYLDTQHAVARSTGEVVKVAWVQVPWGSVLYTPEDQAYYKMRKEKESKEKISRRENKSLGNFFFINSEHTYEDLASQDMIRLVYLGTFIPYGERVLKRGNKKMRKEDLKKELGLPETTFFRFWHNVIDKYLFEDEEGHIFLSKDFKRGKKNGRNKRVMCQKVYIKAVRDLYRGCPISKHKYLGRIFKLLPYINVEHNILCHAPYENDWNYIQQMTLDEFCEKIGVSKENRLRVLKDYAKIKFPVGDHEELACAFVFAENDKSDMRIIINPRILYRGNTWDKGMLIEAFLDR